MPTGKRSVLIKWLFAVGFLLTATAIAAVEYNAYSSDVVQILISDAYYLLLLATAFVIVSAFVAFGAVGAMSHSLSGGRRASRTRPIDALICVIAAALIAVGWSPFDLSSNCPPNPFDNEPHEGYAYDICIGRGIPTRSLVAVLTTLFLLLCVLYLIGAIFAGLSSAYTAGRWAWFVAILLLAIGVVGDGVAWLRNPQSPEPILLFAPLLTLVVILVYSFFGGKRVPAATAT